MKLVKSMVGALENKIEALESDIRFNNLILEEDENLESLNAVARVTLEIQLDEILLDICKTELRKLAPLVRGL